MSIMSAQMGNATMSTCNCTGACRINGSCNGNNSYKSSPTFEELERVIKVVNEQGKTLKELLIELDLIQTLISSSIIVSKKPFKCPVCDGKGGFYISGTIDSECNACEETGIIWG